MAAAPRYRLLRALGSGGMAQVYEAVATGAQGFERRVAIKRILPQLSGDEAMRRMFLDEATIASRLHHGNVVQVLDFGVLDGSEFLVMEHVEGLDARAAVRRSLAAGIAVAPGVALHVAAEVGHALAYLAAANVVHRDVSPQNVLLSWTGDVKLGDFGIALAAARSERTATGVVKGKQAYMAPEQASGSGVGPAADVYGLGATLHALLTGEPPGEDPGALADAGLDEELEHLVWLLLRRDPAERPTASEAASAAGRLAARLLGRDGRSRLVEWLGAVRAAEPPAAASKLDDVMGLCLVALEGPGQERRFTVTREDELEARGDRARPDAEAPTAGAPPSVATAATVQAVPRARGPEAAPGPAAAASPGPAAVGSLETARTPSRAPGERAPAKTDPSLRWLGGLVALLVALAAAMAGAWAFARLSDPEDGDARAGADAAPLPEVAVERPVTTMATAGDAAAQETRAPPATPPAELPPPAEVPPLVVVPPPPVVPPMPTPPAPSPRTAAHGWMRVGGLAIRGADVRVDGRSAGSAPTLVEVRVGDHHVVVVDPATGATLLDGHFVVTSAHTAMRPLIVSLRRAGRPGGWLGRSAPGRPVR